MPDRPSAPVLPAPAPLPAPPTSPAPPGLPALAALAVGWAVTGALVGVATAFLVPTGLRFGAHGTPPTGATVGTGALTRVQAAGGFSYGHVLSLGVGLAFVLVLALALAARISTGMRLFALAPTVGWLVPAMLALSNVHGDIVLPAGGVLPSLQYFYAGVAAGALGLLPRGLLRRRATRSTPPPSPPT